MLKLLLPNLYDTPIISVSGNLETYFVLNFYFHLIIKYIEKHRMEEGFNFSNFSKVRQLLK